MTSNSGKERSRSNTARFWLFTILTGIFGTLPYLRNILEYFFYCDLVWIDYVSATLFIVTCIISAYCEYWDKRQLDSLRKEKRKKEMAPKVLDQFAIADDNKANNVIRQQYCESSRTTPIDYNKLKSTYDIDLEITATCQGLLICVSQMTGIDARNLEVDFMYRYPYEVNGYDNETTWETMSPEQRKANWNGYPAVGYTRINSTIEKYLGADDSFFYSLMTMHQNRILIVNNVKECPTNVKYKMPQNDDQSGSICGRHISLLPTNNLQCDKPIIEAILTINTTNGNLFYSKERELLVTAYSDFDDFKESFRDCVVDPFAQRLRALLADKFISHCLSKGLTTAFPIPCSSKSECKSDSDASTQTTSELDHQSPPPASPESSRSLEASTLDNPSVPPMA